MPTLRELGEAEVVRRLIAARSAARPEPARAGFESGVVLDAGDDAAVLAPRGGVDLVATTDAMVEGRHYDPGWLPPAAIGARLAAINLSDLAAMAAEPRWALLSCGVDPDAEVAALLEVQTALALALAREGATLVGGNLSATEGPTWWSLTVLGEAARARLWSRHGARPGDLIAVSGSPGRAAAGLALARRGTHPHAPGWEPLIDAWRNPIARLDLARALAPLGAVTAAIDLSDGLAGDLARLCEASGTGARLEDARGPEDPLLEAAARELGVTPASLRDGPSDDYELLLAIDPAHERAALAAAGQAKVPFAIVGRFTGAPLVIERVAASGATRPLRTPGFDHFAAEPR